MKVTVDHDLCEGNMKCQAAAPEVFEVRNDDLAYVLVDEVPAELYANVENAVRLCPRQAVRWQEEQK